MATEEEWEVYEDIMHDEEQWYEQARKAEEDYWLRMEELSRTCPVCEQHCGKADFEPPYPSVGILYGLWVNECSEHGVFYTYDDGTQEVDDESDV